MWRALFLALGLSCCLLGLEAMAVDKVILRKDSRITPNVALGIQQSAGQAGQLELTPPNWAPWGLIATGVVTILYSFSIPKRVRG